MPVIDEGLPYGQLEERSLRMLEIGSAFSLAETGRSLRVGHAQGATPISHIERLRGLSSGVFRQPVSAVIAADPMPCQTDMARGQPQQLLGNRIRKSFSPAITNTAASK